MKVMKKWLYFILIFALVTTVFVGCKDKAAEEADAIAKLQAEIDALKSDASKEALSTASESESSAETSEQKQKNSSGSSRPKIEKLSENIYDFQVQLDGHIYQLPFPYSELEENGWTLSRPDFLKQIFPPNRSSYRQEAVNDKGEIISICFINATNPNSIPAKDCYIYEVSISYNDNTPELTPDLTVAGGFDAKISPDDLAKLGTPSREYKSDDGNALYIDFVKNTYENISFDFNKGYYDKLPEPTQISEICVEYLNFNGIEKEEANLENIQIPDYVKRYQTPSSFGKGWDSFIVKIEDDMYQLPAPVSVFIDNGWTFDLPENTIFAAKDDSSMIKAMKNNQPTYVSIVNHSDTAQPFENCLVTALSRRKDENKLTFEFYGSITETSVFSEIEKAYGNKFEKESTYSDEYIDYVYGEYPSRLLFTIEKSTGKILAFDVINDPDLVDLPY